MANSKWTSNLKHYISHYKYSEYNVFDILFWLQEFQYQSALRLLQAEAST